MKRILVTGGNGYIGSHTLIELIKSREFEVISVDNYSRSAPGTMDRIEAVCGVSVVNYDVDLCDKAALFHFLDHQKQLDGIKVGS